MHILKTANIVKQSSGSGSATIYSSPDGEGRDLVINQSETGYAFPGNENVPENLLTREPYFADRIPEEFRDQIEYGKFDRGDRHPRYSAEVRIPLDKAKQVSELQQIIEHADNRANLT